MAEPTFLPEWATTDVVLPTAQTQNKIRPKQSLREVGYDKDEVPTAQELNWQLKNIYDWIVDLKGRIDGVDAQPLLSLQDVYPIGSVYVNVSVSANPATFFNFGTWEPLGEGRVLIGAGTGRDVNSVSRNFAAGQLGGEYSHTITNDESAPHTHGLFSDNSNGTPFEVRGLGQSGVIIGNDDTRAGQGFYTTRPSGLGNWVSTVGGGQAHNNIQPYLVVYMWKRTA